MKTKTKKTNKKTNKQTNKNVKKNEYGNLLRRSVPENPVLPFTILFLWKYSDETFVLAK